jgi:benzoate membrane transport protein
MLASDEAGPPASRYWASVVANVLILPVALGATTVISFAGAMPKSYLLAIGGLAILSAFQDAMERTFSEKQFRLGALSAFLVAAAPFSLAGIPSSFWALGAGLAVSFVAERRALFAVWTSNTANDHPESPGR